MKRLTLDETWALCLKMWKWIAKEVRAANKAEKPWDVSELKWDWCKKHRYRRLYYYCFFCEYVEKRKYKCCRENISLLCPPRKIDKDFNCQKKAYQFEKHPIKFYKKLVELNKIRLAKKKTVAKKGKN